MKSELEKQVSSPTVAQTDARTTRTSETRTLSSPAGVFHPVDPNQGCVAKATSDTASDIKPLLISTTPLRRTSDPRLQSPSSSIHTTPTTQSTTVISTPASTVTQSSDVSSGTPGKKKVRPLWLIL